MTAVIGPVGIQHTNLRDRGIPVLFICKIALRMLKIRQTHRQSQILQHGFKVILAHGDKAIDHVHMIRHTIIHGERLRLVHGSFARIHTVDAVVLDLFHFFL